MFEIIKEWLSSLFVNVDSLSLEFINLWSYIILSLGIICLLKFVVYFFKVFANILE